MGMSEVVFLVNMLPNLRRRPFVFGLAGSDEEEEELSRESGMSFLMRLRGRYSSVSVLFLSSANMLLKAAR